MLLGSAYGKVVLDTSGVQKGVKSAQDQMQKLGQTGLKLGAAMKSVGNALTVTATLPILAMGAAAVKAAADAESAMAELNAVIKSTGGVAGVTVKNITDYATAMQKVTKFDDEAIISGQSMLLTFTKIGKDVFPMASTAMLNLAEKFGSIDQASTMLGKALNDPIEGVGALRRVGVSLSDQQEKQIKAFMAVNDVASAQKIILQELEVEFGGLAEAAGATTAGKFVQLQNSIGDLLEVLGGQLIPLLLPVIEGLTSLVNKFAAMPVFVQRGVLVFLAFVAAIGPILSILGTMIGLISGIATAWPALVAGFSAAISTLTAAVTWLIPALASIGAVITGTVLPALAAIAATALTVVLPLAIIIGTLVLLYLAFKNNFMGITTTVKQLWFIIKYYFGKGWEWLVKSVLSGAQKVGEWFIRMRDNIVRIFQFDWGALGRRIIQGIIVGIASQIASLISKVRGAAKAAYDAAKNFLGIKSPSQKFEYLGKMSGMGYTRGFANLVKPAEFARVVSATASPGTSNNYATQQNISNYAPGLSISDVRRLNAETEKRILKQIVRGFSPTRG
jgi:hypothetical protein